MLKIQQIALDLWEADQQAFRESEKSAKKLGVALNEVKEAMPHGGYTLWLKQNGIDRNRANYCMRVAKGKVKKAKTTTVPKGFKKLSILLTVAMFERLSLVAKFQDTEIADYASKVVMEHAVAQEEFANEIWAAIDSAERAREEVIRDEEKAAKVRAEAKKTTDALLANSKKKVAAQEKAVAASA